MGAAASPRSPPDQPAVLLSAGASRQGRTLTHGDVLHLIANARIAAAAAGGRRTPGAAADVPRDGACLRALSGARMRGSISNYLENPDTVDGEPAGGAADGAGDRRAGLGACCTRASATPPQAHTPLQRCCIRWRSRRAHARWAAGGRWRVSACCARSGGNSAWAGCASPILVPCALAPEIERWATALGITMQHIDGQAARGVAVDARYHALMQEAHGT